MSAVKRDVEAALFGSPSGFFDILIGIVLLIVSLVGAVIYLFRPRSRGRHRAARR